MTLVAAAPRTYVDKAHLLDLCRAVETWAAMACDSDTTEVFVALQTGRHWTGRTRAFYTELATHLPVTVLGVDVPRLPAEPGQPRFVGLAAGEKLAREWVLAISGPSPYLLCGVESGELSAHEAQRRFVFRCSHDATVIEDAAERLRARAAGDLDIASPGVALGLASPSML